VAEERLVPVWPLATERLVLRPFERGDLDALHAMHGDDEVARYLYNPARSRDETKALLERKIDGAALSAPGEWVSAAVVLRATGEVVADLALQWVSREHRLGEIGFVCAPAHQGNGYATEAARAFLALAFDQLGLHRVIGRTEARNVASARVLERLGMRREAHFVENEWVKGEWQSGFVYALLEREWRAASAG
jgi:RimJ/RimL family protein N-acetyltransferase